MRLIIEARVELAESDLRPEPRRLAVLDRMDDDLEQLGLTLEEGRELLAAAQSALVSSQAEQWLATEDHCRRCCTPLYHKDSRWVVFRTVFGKVRLHSPRFWSCTCDRSRGTHSSRQSDVHKYSFHGSSGVYTSTITLDPARPYAPNEQWCADPPA